MPLQGVHHDIEKREDSEGPAPQFGDCIYGFAASASRTLLVTSIQPGRAGSM